MYKRPNRRPVNKLDKFAKARWYISRGWPPRYIAEKLQVSPTTVYKWMSLMDYAPIYKTLLKRVLALSPEQQDDLLYSLHAAKKAA